jgi:hypothetical protein
VTVCGENHGGGKRLLRLRCALRASSLGRMLLRCFAGLIAASLILGSPIAAVVFAALMLINLGVIGWQLATFGRLMHRMVEAVARHGGLMPVEPLARAPLAIGTPRTV